MAKASAPKHFPGFYPPIPNLQDREIKRRLKALKLLEDGLEVFQASPETAENKMRLACDVLRKK